MIAVILHPMGKFSYIIKVFLFAKKYILPFSAYRVSDFRLVEYVNIFFRYTL